MSLIPCLFRCIKHPLCAERLLWDSVGKAEGALGAWAVTEQRAREKAQAWRELL